jgi:hypothetical protein
VKRLAPIGMKSATATGRPRTDDLGGKTKGRGLRSAPQTCEHRSDGSKANIALHDIKGLQFRPR